MIIASHGRPAAEVLATRRDEQAIAAVRAFKHSIDPDNVFAASNNFCGKAVPH